MPRNVEHPVTTEERHGGGNLRRDVTTHPAFGQISASRVTGGQVLYGSDFVHHNFIMIRVHASQLNRDLSHDWHFPREQYLELSLSEAQWATFVSSLNAGSGVPCTLSFVHGIGHLPELPDPPKRTAQFRAEMRQTMAGIREQIGKVAVMVRGLKIGEKVKAELVKQLGIVSHRLEESTGFVADSFDAHAETTVEKAKVEINAHLHALVQQAGLQSLIAAAATDFPLRLSEEAKDSDEVPPESLRDA